MKARNPDETRVPKGGGHYWAQVGFQMGVVSEITLSEGGRVLF